MYGTTMIGKLADGVGSEQIAAELRAWEAERDVPGYLSSHVMIADDGRTIINVAVFADKETYMRLADDAEQDKWYQAHYAPLLDGDPQWIDGVWLS